MDFKMNVRHADISDADKEYAEDKVRKLQRYFDRIHSMELTWEGGENDDFRVGLQIHATKQHMLVAEATATTPQDAVDAVIHKMDGQLTKLKERMKDKDRKMSGRMKSARLQDLATPPPEDEETYTDIIERTDFTESSDGEPRV